MSKYASLDMILGKDDADLTALKQGEYATTKIGVIPYTALDYSEYTAAKKECFKMVPTGDGGMAPDLDDDKLMLKVIEAAVDKDTRSDFTFANKDLLKKLNVISATTAIAKLLDPGEINAFAIEIQTLSGFGAKAKKEREKAVKNS